MYSLEINFKKFEKIIKSSKQAYLHLDLFYFYFKMRNQSSKLQKINSKPQFKRIKRKIRAKINRTGRPHVKKNDYNKARRNHAKAYFRAL